MDFIIELPLYKGIDAILIVVDRLLKERYYITYKASDEGITSK